MKETNNMTDKGLSSKTTANVFHVETPIEYVLSTEDLSINQSEKFSWNNSVGKSNSSKSLAQNKLKEYIKILSSANCNSINDIDAVCKSDMSQFEAIYSIKNAVAVGNLDDNGWFIPGMLHWKQILKELLDAELKEDGTIYVRDMDLYMQKKKNLKLAGRYWIYPASFTDKTLFYIDLDYNFVSGLDVSENNKFKVRPIRIVTRCITKYNV